MKFCINCGKKIEKGTKFCPYCGAKQVTSTNTSTQPVNNNAQSQHSDSSQAPQGSFMGTMNNYNQKIYNYAQTNHNSFVGSLAKFFNNYATFSGRSTRSDYWFMVLWIVILDTCLLLSCAIVIGFILFPIAWLVLLIPRNALRARRLRDAGMSDGGIVALLVCCYVFGWTLIPWIILLVYSLMPSVQHPMPMSGTTYQQPQNYTNHYQR